MTKTKDMADPITRTEAKALAEIRERHRSDQDSYEQTARESGLGYLSAERGPQAHQDRGRLLSMLSEPPLPRSGGEAPSVTPHEIEQAKSEGFASGIEAAAKWMEEGGYHASAAHIRTFTQPPSSSPPPDTMKG